MEQTKEIMDVDKEYDQKIEDKHEEEEKKQILQRIEDVLDMGKLMRMNFFDALYKVYDMGYGIGFEEGQQREPEWSDFER